MTEQTRNIITSACAMDPTIKPEDAERGIAIIGGQANHEAQDDRPVRATEAAKMLNTTTKTVRLWGKAGCFRSIRVPGGKQICGYVRADIENFRRGRMALPPTSPSTPTTKSTGNRRSPRRKAA